MAARTFDHEVVIATDPSRVHAFLGDLHNHRELHPLIVTIDDLEADPSSPGLRSYEITDRVPVGPVSIKVRYRADVEIIDDTTIRATATQRPRVRLETTYVIESAPDGARVREAVRVEAPRLLIGFVARQAESAHAATLAALRTHLEPT